MGDDNNKEEIVRAATDIEMVSSDDLASGQIELEEYNNIPWDNVMFAGTSLSSLLPAFRSVTGTAQMAMDGLYRGDALGKVGALAQAKDGSGSLGAIIKDGKIVGQMRWQPIDSAPLKINATMPIDPMTLAIAAVVMEINMKLDAIQELQQEMFDYMKDKDRSEIKGSLRFLIDTLNDYKFNWDNQRFLDSKLNEVQSIERLAHAKIIFYRDQIAKKASKQDAVYFGNSVEDRIRSINEGFKDYKLSLGMYSFAVYIEVLLSKNFEEDFLRKKSAQIYDQSIEYRKNYTDAYNALKEYSTKSIEQTVLGGLSFITKGLGDVLSNTPIGDTTSINDFLIDSGKNMESFSSEISDKSVNQLAESKDCDVRVFSDSIDKIRDMYNGAMEYVFTDEGIHYRELPSGNQDAAGIGLGR